MSRLPPTKLAALLTGFVSAAISLAAEGKNTVSAGLWLVPWFVFLALERASEAVQAGAVMSDGAGWRSKVRAWQRSRKTSMSSSSVLLTARMSSPTRSRYP